MRERALYRSSLECPSSCNDAEYDGPRAEGGGRMSRGDKLPRHTFPSSHAFPELVDEARGKPVASRVAGRSGRAELQKVCLNAGETPLKISDR